MGDTLLGDTFVGHGERVSSSFISPSRRRLFSGSTGSMEGILAGSTGSLEDILSRTHQRLSDRSAPPVDVMSARSRDWREAYLAEGCTHIYHDSATKSALAGSDCPSLNIIITFVYWGCLFARYAGQPV